jgi:hypothetical protein
VFDGKVIEPYTLKALTELVKVSFASKADMSKPSIFAAAFTVRLQTPESEAASPMTLSEAVGTVSPVVPPEAAAQIAVSFQFAVAPDMTKYLSAIMLIRHKNS